MAPTVTCLIAATQRSGSTLLCRALADTGVAGRPEEYFLCGPAHAFPPGWRFWEDGIFATGHPGLDREGYLDLVFRLGSTRNGVFAAKLMWNNVPWVLEKLQDLPRFADLDRAQAFTALFPNLRVVHLTRRDRVAQAVSWARAAQDGVWVVSETEPPAPAKQPVYDGRLIVGLEGLLADGEQGWPELCRELDIVPLSVAYEDLVEPTTYDAVVRSVLAHLGVDDPGIVVRPPRTHRQADDLNRVWIDRYLTDRGRAARRPPTDLEV